MISVTQYTPKRIADFPDIWRAWERLAKWWSDDFQNGTALIEGLQLLASHQECRVVLPKLLRARIP